jgi:hypothetical protein
MPQVVLGTLFQSIPLECLEELLNDKAGAWLTQVEEELVRLPNSLTARDHAKLMVFRLLMKV